MTPCSVRGGRGAGIAWCLLALVAVVCPGPAWADWLSELETYALARMQDYASPGMAIVIVQNDQVLLAKGYGQRTAGEPGAVDADTVFLLGSTSKAFCAAQLAVLAEAGRIGWHDTVRGHLPDFRLYDAAVSERFQVEDMLSHRSGLPMYALTMMEILDYPTADRVRGVRFVAPVTSFRTTFAYQNVLYTTASQLVEAVTGLPWREHLARSIFAPLGMTRSVASQADVDALDNVAVGHLRLANDSLWPIPADWFWNETQDRAMAAAAVRTTANDLGRWLRFFLAEGRIDGKRVLSPDTIHYLLAPKVLVSPWEHGTGSPHAGPVSYCAGWMRYDLSPQPFLFHEGGAMGSGSAVGFAPGAGVGIAVLSNVLAGDGLATDVVWKFYDLFFAAGGTAGASAQAPTEAVAAGAPAHTGAAATPAQTVAAGAPAHTGAAGAPAQAGPAGPAGPPPGGATGRAGTGTTVPGLPLARAATAVPDLPLARYCGRYGNPAYGLFAVHLAGDHLEIVMGPRHWRARLQPEGGNAFTAVLPGYPEGFEMTIPMTFAFPADGPAVLTTGPILHDPAETFPGIGPDLSGQLLLLRNGD
ncbi:MAG: serine hydrolase [Solidesulfovibrio sp. DCME]|uniref:serine hydrolase n=1 Tax=Solidesulfovibrio sp. DCME TaxID=3447380 RepID=UPI003D1175C2